MQMKKKIAKVVIAAAVLVGATSPVSAVSICDIPATSVDIWFIQQFVCG